MPKIKARLAVVSVGGLVQADVHGVRFVLNSTEAWDLGALLCDAAAHADGRQPIDWDAISQKGKGDAWTLTEAAEREGG